MGDVTGGMLGGSGNTFRGLRRHLKHIGTKFNVVEVFRSQFILLLMGHTRSALENPRCVNIVCEVRRLKRKSSPTRFPEQLQKHIKADDYQ